MRRNTELEVIEPDKRQRAAKEGQRKGKCRLSECVCMYVYETVTHLKALTSLSAFCYSTIQI